MSYELDFTGEPDAGTTCPSGSGRAWRNGRSDAFRAAILLHRDNPKAANQVVIGLLFVVFASSVTALITF